MKNKLALAAFTILFCSSIQAQTVSVSDDDKKISFVITDKTTPSEIRKADSVFAEHQISTDIKASWKKGNISKLSVTVKCAQGNIEYKTTDFGSLKNGVRILVDKTSNATTALAVGPVEQ